MLKTATFELHNTTCRVQESPLPDRQKVLPNGKVGPIEGQWESDPKVVRVLASGRFTVVNRVLCEEPAAEVVAEAPAPKPKASPAKKSKRSTSRK